jgi:putative tricarboxylic transport membrane protein
MRRYFKRYGELYFFTFIFFSALYLLVSKDKLIRLSGRATHDMLGPQYWPVLILWGILILTVGGFIFKYKTIRDRKWDVEAEDVCFTEFSDIRLLKLIVSTGLYIHLLSTLGFIVLTPIFLFFVNETVQIKGFGKKVFISLLITAFLIFVFGRFLMIPLPRGAGALREFSFLIY